MSDLSAYLTRVADRLEQPGAWTQGAYARRADGTPTNADDDTATCWCLEGALTKDAPFSGSAMLEARMLLPAVGPRIPTWNDAPDRTQAEVVAVLRQAAEIAK